MAVLRRGERVRVQRKRDERQRTLQSVGCYVGGPPRCRLAPFVKLAKTITEQRDGIESALRHGLSNPPVELVNTQLRCITRRAFGFRSSRVALALAMLALGGPCPSLPGR